MSAIIDTFTAERLLATYGGKSISWDVMRRCWVIDGLGIYICPDTWEKIDVSDQGSEAGEGQSGVE